MHRKSIDVWVGLFVLLGLAALLFLALKAGNMSTLSFSNNYVVTGYFDNIGGLKPQAPVKSAGVVVGRVAEIKFDDKRYKALVTLELETGYKFPKDSSLKILTAGLLGEQYIGIEAGGDTNNLVNGLSPSAQQSFAPGILLGLQYNLRDNWFFDFNTQLSSFSADNGLAGSSPNSLGYSFMRYTAAVGYNYKYDDDPEGISFAASIGIDSYKSSVSTSAPTAITSTDTNALSLHLQALMPLGPDYPYSIGARFNFALNPSQSESPVNSGSAKPTITSLGFFGLYPLNEKLRIRVDLDLTNINTRYSGGGTRTPAAGSSSIEMMSEQFGVEYLF